MVENYNNIVVLVSSCDKFEDAWHPFFTLFFRYWPDCPFPVYLISNYKKFNDTRVNTICVGKDWGWADNIKTALNKINKPYCLYLQEDYFFTKKIDTKNIISLLDLMSADHLGHIRLVPEPKPTLYYKQYKNLGIINKGSEYRVSLQAGLWNTKVLRKLITPNEQAWDMELKGSERSNKIDDLFLAVKKPAIDYYMTGIVKGKWEYGVINFLKSEGITVDTGKRPVEPYKTYLKRKLRTIPVLKYIFIFVFLFTEKYKRSKNEKNL